VQQYPFDEIKGEHSDLAFVQVLESQSQALQRKYWKVAFALMVDPTYSETLWRRQRLGLLKAVRPLTRNAHAEIYSHWRLLKFKSHRGWLSTYAAADLSSRHAAARKLNDVSPNLGTRLIHPILQSLLCDDKTSHSVLQHFGNPLRLSMAVWC